MIMFNLSIEPLEPLLLFFDVHDPTTLHISQFLFSLGPILSQVISWGEGGNIPSSKGTSRIKVELHWLTGSKQ